MLTRTAYGDTRLSLWQRVREFAVPPSMIETATARRRTGDWAGACAAAGVDVDLDLRRAARTYGREPVARLRADLRRLAPDLLRWHMPRIAPDGLLRPGLTIALARYDTAGDEVVRPLFLVVRTPPAWADAGQRISLALWDGSRDDAATRRHPHPRPDRRFRLDLHRHLWDARRTGELRTRSGADRSPGDGGPAADPAPWENVPPGYGCAVDRWAVEAAVLLAAEGRDSGDVTVRLDARHRLNLHLPADRDGLGPRTVRITAATADGGARTRPLLPDAATWVPPDLELLRTGRITADRLHPLVASALAPGHPSAPARLPDPAGRPRLVECRGARHRIGLVDGVLTPLDHDPGEVRRELLLAELTGTPLPCLQVIDEAHRRPECLADIRERIDHGDIAGALAVVEGLLGPAALLRDGALRDELEAAAQRRIVYGLFRTGLFGPGPDRLRPGPRRSAAHRSHPRHTTAR
ncbi:hypothetical protein [Streptomyces sp. NPDC059378]|uniref:hypothetical protein n=1 Tax=Streptomyces sp. NPDC059378 TaxID=3346815 RepID=UPI003686DCB3